MKFLWVINFLTTTVAGLVVLVGLASSGSAPQQAATFALACAIAIIPYVFARAAEAFSATSIDEASKRVVQAIEASNRPVVLPMTGTTPVSSSGPQRNSEDKPAWMLR